MAEDLKFIRQELYEAYEMNDRILVGYALNRLDTYLKEQKEAEEQKETSPAFSNVIGGFEPSYDQFREIANEVELYIQNRKEYKARIALGEFVYRFKPLYDKLYKKQEAQK